MDEEDSQDELINKNASHGKGKRPATSILSDEEENSEDGDDSQDGATDSEEEEDDDVSVDGEGEDGEEEEEEEEEVDSEHEEAEKDLEGAAGSTSIDLAGLSSDEDAEKCPICLNSFHEQPVATPESCSHYFCLDCILEWAKNANSCPVDRKVFSNILLRKCFGGKVQKTITVQKTAKAGQEEQVDLDLEQTSCEVCGGSDREDRLLLCDGCDAGYHMECLTPPLDAVPVEEWFCPECAANNRNTRRERSSEDENSILPTTSRPQPANSRPTRAIARTQHSERVRANVNRHRITQARTAAQIAPRYLMQSTWLDETINAVVAGLNTAVYVRDLTPRPRSRRRRRTVKRRRGNKEGKAAGGKTASTGVRRRKRRARRTKSRKKLVAKKTATTRGRIARSLGIKNHGRSASIPSVYRPSEQTLGSMRADIGAASLSIYGDPFDLDPFDDENEETQQAPTPSSLLEAKRRGLSRSALRSHQPVARPISAGIPRRGHSIPQVQEVAEAAPVPDLLGSILSGQSMLLMDSSDVVINRDGSLKATKPVSLSLPRSSISGSSMSEESRTPSTEASLFQSSSSSSSSSRPLQRRSSSHSSPLSSPAPLTPVSPSPPTSLTPSSLPGHSRLHTPLPHRSVPSHSAGTEHSQWGTCGFRGQPTSRVPSGASDSRCGERGDAAQQPPAKKPPSKPVWVDVSGLPRIPKIKREGSSAAHGSNRSNNNNFPESSMTSLAGDKGRQHTVDQRAASASQQSRAVDSQRQRLDRTGPSSSFSNSFSAPSSSASVTSNTRPSSSSAISFRINASGNPWHARRLSAPESAMPIKDEKSTKRTQKNKQMLLTSLSQAKKASVKSEVYDPFNPTGSDSSESEAESDCPEMDPQSSVPMQPTVEQNEGPVQQIKTEPMDLDSPVEEASSETCMQIKKEPTSFKEDPWPLPSHNLATGHIQTQSGSLAAVMAYSESPAMSDAESNGTPESPFAKNLGRSRSSSTSSRHSDSKMKIEVKAEPEDQPCPVQPKCKTEPEVPKGNGLCDEVPSAASSFDVSHKSKEQEVISPCPQPEEEGRQGESASQSPPSKDFEHSHKKKKHSRSEEGRHSRSRSPGHRRSRSKSKEKRRSRSRSKDRRRSRSRSKDRRRSRSRSKDKRRSRSRSKDKRRSRSRSKDKRRSRSRSKDKRRSRSRSKDKRRSRSRSKDKRRSRSRSKEKRPSRSRSKERRRSRSRSKERRRSRSRSRERRHSRSRDRMHSTRSSSNESSRKRKPTRDGREQYDSRGRDEHKRSKDKKRSRSRSGSRTRERRREQTSSASRDGGELRSKRKRSRSTSRDPKRRVNVPECSRQKERNKSTASTSIEATAPNHSSNINAIASKEKTDSGGNQCEARVSLVSVKRETEPSSPGCSTLIEESNPEEITKTTPLVAVSNKPHEIKPNQIKQETIWPLEFTEPQLEIKEEKEESNECEELKQPEEIKKEDVTSTSVNEKLEEFSEISSNTSTPRTQTSYSLPQDGKSSNDSFELPKQVKIEHIWPDEEEEEEEEDDDDNPYSDTALVINLCPPAPIDCKTETEDELTSLPVVAKEEMEVEPLQAPCVVKQEPVDSSDEDINVDFLIDNLDFIKKEMKEGSVTDPAGTVEPQPVTQEVSTGSKQEMESALVVAGTKGKSQGKRVTWNIQEPEGPQPEKMSKLALFKLKLKQEGSRRAASTSFTQSCSQDPATVQVGAKPAVTSLNPLAQEGRPNSDQGGSKAHKEELAHDPQHKDKYMKKLHMQERAIEEVKLAIKPFYQKRDITKEEYKEILRKAVQKVCHSKSGEINPVKVANLVKAYVDKYKHARKHRKIGSTGQGHSAEGPKDSETPG